MNDSTRAAGAETRWFWSNQDRAWVHKRLGFIAQQRQANDAPPDDVPWYGEVWLHEPKDGPEHHVLVLGNGTEEDMIWCSDWQSGKRCYPRLDEMRFDSSQAQPDREMLFARLFEWAHDGYSDVLWWLAWWFETDDRLPSLDALKVTTWFYVAALRADPQRHGWACERIYDDTRSAARRRGHLAFFRQVQEFGWWRQGNRWIGTNWKSALSAAERALCRCVRNGDWAPEYCPCRGRFLSAIPQHE